MNVGTSSPHSNGENGRETKTLPERDFVLTLQDERARADREGTEFSLVAYRIATGAVAADHADRFIEALSKRCRGIDSVGWIDDQHLGVLLPVTDREGSARFVEDLDSRDPTLRLPRVVFHYGRKWSYLARSNGHLPHEVESSSTLFESTHDSLDADGVAALEDRLKEAFARGIPGWKRFLDLIVASIALVVFAPIAAFLAVYIKLVSPGPVLFKQQRIGYMGEPFTFLKFRTMHVSNDHSTHTSHLRNLIHSEQPMEKLDDAGDPRIIPGGRLLRRACIDEFPQLVNVLRGEMSLVGPRPCLPYEAEEFLRWHAYRFDVLPGITGLWQVSGKNKLTFAQMIRLDILYGNSMSLWLDLKILLRTPVAVVGWVAEAVVRHLKKTGKVARIQLRQEGGRIQ